MSSEPRFAGSGRVGRAIAAGVIALTALVGAAGCDYQTLQPYTPADGVNTAVGDVKVRNLVIVATGDGEGVLLGTLVADSADALESIAGTALQANGDPGAALQFTSTKTLTVSHTEPVQLIDGAIQVTATGLVAGLTAEVELTFTRSGSVTVLVPIMDQASPEYAELDLPSSAPSGEADA